MWSSARKEWKCMHVIYSSELSRPPLCIIQPVFFWVYNFMVYYMHTYIYTKYRHMQAYHIYHTNHIPLHIPQCVHTCTHMCCICHAIYTSAYISITQHSYIHTDLAHKISTHHSFAYIGSHVYYICTYHTHMHTYAYTQINILHTPYTHRHSPIRTYITQTHSCTPHIGTHTYITHRCTHIPTHAEVWFSRSYHV